jgi:hypothetical protein
MPPLEPINAPRINVSDENKSLNQQDVAAPPNRKKSILVRKRQNDSKKEDKIAKRAKVEKAHRVNYYIITSQ